MKKLKISVILGNGLISLWVIYNAIDSGFAGTRYEIGSFIFLITLLILNSYLIINGSDRQ